MLRVSETSFSVLSIRIPLSISCVVLCVISPNSLSARHLARFDPTEPIFTQRSFVEKNLEWDVSWAKQCGSNEIELGPALSWVLWGRLQLGVEMPYGAQIPDQGATLTNIADVGFSAQLMLCCEPDEVLDYFSLRVDVEAPTGSRSKDIGGDGSWSVSLLPGRDFTILRSLPDLFVQLQLAYTQQIRLGGEEEEAAREFGLSKTLTKEFDWNIAFAQAYFEGRIRPVFEVLGTTLVDTLLEDDEGTIVELAGGVWLAPFPDEHWLSAVSMGMGWKFPVTSRKENQSVGLFIVEWAFD